MANERQELEGLKTLANGTLVLRTKGTLRVGSHYSRVNSGDNDTDPEYLLGKLAIRAGHESGEEVYYEIRVKPRRSTLS